MKKFSATVVDLLIAQRIPLFLTAAVLAAAAFWPAGRIQFDRSVENMFAPGDPLLEPYLKLKRTFGGNEIVLAVYEDDDLLDPNADGIRHLAEVRQQLNDVPGVRSALSLDQPLDIDQIVNPDSRIAALMREQFQGYTHSADGRIAAVTVVHDVAGQGAPTFGFMDLYVGALPPPGDATGEGCVDGADYTAWADHYLQTGLPAYGAGGWSVGNWTDDDTVDGADYTAWADNYLEGCPAQVPEPVGLLALGLGACLALLRCKR